MRKKIIVLIILTFIFVSGLCAWEGAAATAPDGELPSTGRYVATNSFPRNTVVDITNIETNRSTRVIVANSLDSPGLLAVVSREAAELIGMRSGSISRIRMSQPSDPIAYLRFTEGLAAGIPEFDSGNVITEENFIDDMILPEVLPESPPVSAAPGYILESEWGGRMSSIVEVSEDTIPEEPPHSAFFNEPSEHTHVEEIVEYIPAEPVEEIAEYIHEEEPAEPVEEIAEYIPEEESVEEIAEYIPEEEPAEELAEYIPEEEPTEPVEEIAEYIPEEEPVEEIAEYIPEEEPIEPVEEIAEHIPDEPPVIGPAGEVAQFNIVPAQERPPAEPGTIYGIDPADIIPGISRVIPAQEPARNTTEHDAALSILMNEVEPVRQPPVVSVVAPALQNEVSIVPEKEIIQSVPASKRPGISELNRGAYYVQLAAHESAESAEQAIGLIDRNYGPLVYNDGSSWYRILLGPLNQGESAAVLQRFKSIGYKDAFVRHIR